MANELRLHLTDQIDLFSSMKEGVMFRIFSFLGSIAVFFFALSGVIYSQSTPIPKPGIYRLDGNMAGQTFEITEVSRSSFKFRHWQTATPEPPPPGAYFYAIGKAQLLPDGKTWLILQKNVDGWCCGNMIDSEIQFTNETTFIGIRYRLWDPAGAKPGPNDGWRSSGYGEYKLVAPKPVSGPPMPDQNPFKTGPKDGTDTGVRFGSLSGQVEIVPSGKSRSQAGFAKMSTVIREGDRIITGENSSAIVSFPDLSSVYIPPDSEIIVTSTPTINSKLALVAGNIWVNIKQMWRDGSMQIDMSQAVAGIKGTKLIAQNYPEWCSITVIEGLVTVESKNGRGSTQVRAGERVTITRSEIMKGHFDWDAMRERWDKVLPPGEWPADKGAASVVNPDRLGRIWRIREENQQGQGCDGTWTRRSGTSIFDARWQCGGGPVEDVVEIEKVSGNEVVVFRRGMRNRYYLTLSPDGKRIVSGRIAWAPDWRFTGTITQ